MIDCYTHRSRKASGDIYIYINDRWEHASNKMCAVVIEPLCSIGKMAVFNNLHLYLFPLRNWIVVGDRVAGEVFSRTPMFDTGWS